MLSNVLRAELERLALGRLQADLLATIATKILYTAVENWLNDKEIPSQRQLTDHIADGVHTLVELLARR